MPATISATKIVLIKFKAKMTKSLILEALPKCSLIVNCKFLDNFSAALVVLDNAVKKRPLEGFHGILHIRR